MCLFLYYCYWIIKKLINICYVYLNNIFLLTNFNVWNDWNFNWETRSMMTARGSCLSKIDFVPILPGLLWISFFNSRCCYYQHFIDFKVGLLKFVKPISNDGRGRLRYFNFWRIILFNQFSFNLYKYWCIYNYLFWMAFIWQLLSCYNI
jgi:hypothetical protein